MRSLVVLALLGFFALSLAETETLGAGVAKVETVAAGDVPMEADRLKREDDSVDDILEAIDDALAITPKRPGKPKGPKMPPSRPTRPTSRVTVAALLRVMAAIRRLAKVRPSTPIAPVVARMLDVMRKAGINVTPLMATLRRMGVKLSGDPVFDVIILEDEMADPVKVTDILAAIFRFIANLIKQAGGAADFDGELDGSESGDYLEDPRVMQMFSRIMKFIPPRMVARVLSLLRRFPLERVKQMLRAQGIRIPGFNDYSDDLTYDGLEDPETSEDPFFHQSFVIPRRVLLAVRILDSVDDGMMGEMMKEPTFKKFIIKFYGKLRANLTKKTTVVNISDENDNTGADEPETETAAN